MLAFDLKTGKILWATRGEPLESNDVYITNCRGQEKENPNCPEKNGPDVDFGTSPVLAKTPSGKELIVIGSKNGLGMAMDPDQSGKMLWQYRAGQGSTLGGIEWGTATDGEKIYFPLSDINTPKPGGLHAVSPATGERVWYAPPVRPECPQGPAGCNAAQSAAITVIPGVVFSGANDGGCAPTQPRRRINHLDVRHQPRVRHAEWRTRARRVDDWSGTCDRRRNALLQFWLWRVRRTARQCFSLASAVNSNSNK